MNKRCVKINDLIVESIEHTVENKGSVVASVVYLNEDIIE
jgi:arginine decarboxylase